MRGSKGAKAKRLTKSEQMSRVKGKDTKPEMLIRRLLTAEGVRYRLHYELPGKPDVYIPRLRLALFVNGCFWHQHGCARSTAPKSNAPFWAEKLAKNAARDKRNYERLGAEGVKVQVLWTCQEDSFARRCISIAKEYRAHGR